MAYNLSSNILLFTESNAFQKSTKMALTAPPWSSAVCHTHARVVKLCLQRPNWFGLNVGSKDQSSHLPINYGLEIFATQVRSRTGLTCSLS